MIITFTFERVGHINKTQIAHFHLNLKQALKCALNAGRMKVSTKRGFFFPLHIYIALLSQVDIADIAAELVSWERLDLCNCIANAKEEELDVGKARLKLSLSLSLYQRALPQHQQEIFDNIPGAYKSTTLLNFHLPTHAKLSLLHRMQVADQFLIRSIVLNAMIGLIASLYIHILYALTDFKYLKKVPHKYVRNLLADGKIRCSDRI